ncbi:polyketide antibiotic transporter [Microbacterium capsulatum]|uniref:Polyketide antibiotic transporter n=1 Tax=Microbacterium capsulatum TaxID=3041921 RepID=A0ABU0XNM9_9MICO|nr:polyketide antibiotic transporter [Microbacterium sp. ASV81]MDQ4215715.1 polyketide antibiotic transporter [Microbacterium sp. ASV81]
MSVLLRQRLRRDWLQVLLWILATVLMAYAGYAGVTQSYATTTDRVQVLAAVMANPVIMMFRGLPSGASEGQFLSFEILPWLTMLAGLMSTFLAVRHTRGDEEAGRSELVAATPAGRALPTVATIIHGVGANVILGVLVALALIGSKLDPAGSWLMGATSATTGIAFLGIGLIAAQLMRTSRGANALTVWILVGTFLVNGIGNVAGTPSNDLTRITSSGLVWLSPFGWAEQARPYDANDAGPALLGLVFGLVLAVAAVALQSVRDIGEGFIPARPGRTHARPALSSPHALVWRLTNGAIIGWAVGGALTGVLATKLSGLAGQISGQNPAVQQILDKIGKAGNLEETVVSVFFTMMGILAACAAVQILARARQEEAHGTAENVLSRPVGRVRWLLDYLLVATFAIAIIVAAAMLAALGGLSGNAHASSLSKVVMVVGLGQGLAACVFTVVTALVFVLIPRGTIAVAWSLLLLATMFGLFGPLFGLPEWTTRFSPFAVTPIVSNGTADLRGTWWLVLVVAVGAVASLVLMRRRQLQTSS